MVAQERKGGLKGGLVRAARHTPAQRSASASMTVRTRSAATPDNPDRALRDLLKSLRASTDIAEIRALSEKIERVVFHKQFEDA